MKIPFSRTNAFAALTVAALLFAPQILRADHGGNRNNPFLDVASSTSRQADSGTAVARANELSNVFRSASNKVLPTLVAIETTVHVGSMPGANRSRPFAPPSSEPAMGLGSGVIVDSSGVILTNNHVVAGGRGEVTVRLSDGREFPAVEVLTDSKSDIAVIRIEGASDLMAATMGDSDHAEIGDWVLALGQPFGLESTVTAGIVSAKQRGIGMSERESYIQTDAAINPGNSGGPLVNLNGEVVGINAAISSRSGGNEGIGFAVPINLARWVGGQLMEHGVVHRSYMGVGVQELDASLARQFGVSPKGGVAVTLVQSGSPAAEARLRVGDIIVSCDGEKIHDPSQLQLVVERCEPGQSQSIEIIREGKQVSFKVTPAQQADQSISADIPAFNSAVESGSESHLGMRVETLRQEIADQIGVSDSDGVVVTAIARGSAAQRAGLQPGVVVTEVNRQAIHTIDDFVTVMKSADSNAGILMLVKTGDVARFIVLKTTS